MIFELDELNKSSIKTENNKGITFTQQGTEYYFKYCKRKENFLNELIASRLAKQLKIPCCEYYLGKKNHSIGVVSRKFDTTTYQSMHQVIYDYYNNQLTDFYNNFEDLDNLFYQKYGETVERRLMSDLVNIFLFDVLIANPDRHTNNYGLWEHNNQIEFAPLFDQENMLSYLSITYGKYSIGVEQDDFLKHFYYLSCKSPHMLEKFLKIGTEEYRERLMNHLSLIGKENINKILLEIEEDIKIEEGMKTTIIEKFQENQNQIEQVCKKIYQKK